MLKRDVENFISHWKGATAPEQSISLTDAEILERLVALNAERAAEEARGVIHWLRPEYQARNQKPEVRRKWICRSAKRRKDSEYVAKLFKQAAAFYIAADYKPPKIKDEPT